MKKNMGSTDKSVRLILAAIFIVLFLTHIVSGALGYILLGLAVIFIVTSLISFCPLYTLINANTCSAKEKEANKGGA